MTRLTKKQRQQFFLEEFLRRTPEAAPGERVYLAAGDLFEAAEVHLRANPGLDKAVDGRGPLREICSLGE